MGFFARSWHSLQPMSPPSDASAGPGAHLNQSEAPQKRTVISRITSFFLYLFDRITPDPFIFAVILTFLTAILALLFAPKNSPDIRLGSWYKGLFEILTFAF